MAASSTPGRILQLPARKSSPNHATTNDTLSTAGAMDCSRSSATTISAVSEMAFRFSATVVPPDVRPKRVGVPPLVFLTGTVA